MPPRQDSGYASAHRAFANLKFTVATDKRRISDFDTSHVGDRVKSPRPALKRNPKIASANNFIFNDRCGWRFACGRLEHDYEHEQEH